jgi:HK97 family phage major capsid protein
MLRRVVHWLFAMLAVLVPKAPALPRVIRFNLHPFMKRCYGKVLAGGSNAPSFAAVAVAALVTIIGAVLLTPLAAAGGLLLAFPAAAVPAKSANIRQMEADFRALAKELEIGEAEMRAGPITEARGKELEEKAKEMEELQKHLDQYNRIAGITRAARQVESPTLPTDAKGKPRIIHTTPGHLFIASDSFRQYRANGKEGWSSKVEVKSLKAGMVQLVGEEADKFEAKAFDPATLSDLGADAVIQPQLDTEIVRYAEPEILTIRDVLGSAPTTSDSVRYVRHVATTRGAAAQATRGGPKPYLRVAFEAATAAVETIAVLSKVTEQDIDDAPRLVAYINGEMRLDVKVEEDRLLLHGSGAAGEILGLYGAGITEFDRAVVGDTLIDTIRRMRTDLRRSRVLPNFVAIDPLDWEEIELAKGTDERYVWGLITDLRGPRIWSLRVVESDAMTHPTTGERRVLMGDGIRGATVYDRHDVRLAVGYVDDDFARNLRTLRAEERLALAVKRAYAFKYSVTQAGES